MTEKCKLWLDSMNSDRDCNAVEFKTAGKTYFIILSMGIQERKISTLYAIWHNDIFVSCTNDFEIAAMIYTAFEKAYFQEITLDTVQAQCYLDHAAKKTGYLSLDKSPIIKPYKGKFGNGYTVEENIPATSGGNRVHAISYYIYHIGG